MSLAEGCSIAHLLQVHWEEFQVRDSLNETAEPTGQKLSARARSRVSATGAAVRQAGLLMNVTVSGEALGELYA